MFQSFFNEKKRKGEKWGEEVFSVFIFLFKLERYGEERRDEGHVLISIPVLPHQQYGGIISHNPPYFQPNFHHLLTIFITSQMYLCFHHCWTCHLIVSKGNIFLFFYIKHSSLCCTSKPNQHLLCFRIWFQFQFTSIIYGFEVMYNPNFI